jgi:hypothetical protein
VESPCSRTGRITEGVGCLVVGVIFLADSGPPEARGNGGCVAVCIMLVSVDHPCPCLTAASATEALCYCTYVVHTLLFDLLLVPDFQYRDYRRVSYTSLQ